MLLRLLTLPVSGPIAGIKYVLEKVGELAEREMWDDEPVREQLILVNEAYEQGRMPESEFRQREAELLARLREIKAHRQAQAQNEAGAAVDERRRVVIDSPDELR